MQGGRLGMRGVGVCDVVPDGVMMQAERHYRCGYRFCNPFGIRSPENMTSDRAEIAATKHLSYPYTTNSVKYHIVYPVI
jgi:hypothetical protein